MRIVKFIVVMSLLALVALYIIFTFNVMQESIWRPGKSEWTEEEKLFNVPREVR